MQTSIDSGALQMRRCLTFASNSEDFEFIYFKEFPPFNRYKFTTATVAPRPIALVTTLGLNGQVNSAPFSQFIILFSKPPKIGIVVGQQWSEPHASNFLLDISHIERFCRGYWYKLYRSIRFIYVIRMSRSNYVAAPANIQVMVPVLPAESDFYFAVEDNGAILTQARPSTGCWRNDSRATKPDREAPMEARILERELTGRQDIRNRTLSEC